MRPASDVAAALVVLRMARGMSQRQVVQKTKNMTQGMLCGYERGRRAPNLPNLRAILKALHFTLGDLDAVMEFLRELRGEPPAEASADQLRREVVGSVLRLVSALIGLIQHERNEP